MSDLREANGLVERIILRRLFEERLDGYTIETAEEIVAALSAQPHPKAVEADQIQRAMDMLGDVPGNTILECVERIVSYYLALQCELEKVRAVPPLAPDERMRRALERIRDFPHLCQPCEQAMARIAHEALSRAREGLPPLSCDFAQSLPGGKLDDSTYGKIEDALDKIEAPAQDANGKWLSLHERIATICSPTEARMRAALERIAGSHWGRAGYCQSDVEDVPDLTAEEAMREAREALSGAADASNASAEANGDSLDKRLARLEREASDLGYVLTPEPDHPDSPHRSPSDPIPSEQREAVARAIVEFARDGFTTIRLVRDVGPYEITEPTPAAFEFADAILALSTRAGG